MTFNPLKETSNLQTHFLEAVSMRACAVALTTCKERSSQSESIQRSFSISESSAGFSG